MINFRQYLLEATKPSGNYCSIGVEIPPVMPGFIPPTTGEPTAYDNLHTTLVYSPSSSINPSVLLELLESRFPHNIAVQGVEFAAFNACLVLKLQSALLQTIHHTLLDQGCIHTYEEYSPHITLYHGVNIDECRVIAAVSNMRVKLPVDIRLTSYKSEPIIENWNEINNR